jgi:hypothetical protein
MNFAIIPSQTELTLPTEWDHDNEMLNDEELSATSHEEASKVLEQWQADQDQDLDIMEVDEQIGSNLLGDDLFDTSCASPAGPLEELDYMNVEEDDDRFFTPLLEDETQIQPTTSTSTTSTSTTSSLPFEERYAVTLKKLQESMKRSQETRKSLTMKTPKTEKYPRTKSVSGVLSSIEVSSHQLQGYLKNLQQRTLA